MQEAKIVFMDTDSVCCTANEAGKRAGVSCNDLAYFEGADPREFDPIPCAPRKKILEISKRFESLDNYSFGGTILAVEKVNHVDDEPKKPFRDLYGFAISVKRYSLFEGKHARKIVDAKAHGIGYLMSPIKRDKDGDTFATQFWQQVLRNEGVSYRSLKPDWLDYPAMMKIPVSSPAVLGRLKDFCNPHDFVLAPIVRDVDMDEQAEKPILITRFTKHSEEWIKAEYFNVRTGEKVRITTNHNARARKGVIPVRSYRDVVNGYVNNPESKFNAADGKSSCWAYTRGVLQRRHVVAKSHKYCGKETKRKLEQGPLNHEADCKCIVYENGRVELDESIKSEMREIGPREFMRRGIAQHTYEKALRGEAIKKITYERILAVIESCKKEAANGSGLNSHTKFIREAAHPVSPSTT